MKKMYNFLLMLFCLLALPFGMMAQQGFGNQVWNVNAYYSSTFDNYAGYYVDPNLNFNTRTFWDESTSPSSAAGYTGGAIWMDNHSYIAKRQGFPAGCYQINVVKHDDGTTLLINGIQVFQDLGCCGPNPNVWRGTLDANSTVEIRMSEGTGASEANYEFVSITPTPMYVDNDGDGYGSSVLPIVNVCGPTTGYSLNNYDCDDNNNADAIVCQNSGTNVVCGCTCPDGFSGMTCQTNAYCVPTYSEVNNADVIVGVLGLSPLYNWTNTQNNGYTFYGGQPTLTASLNVAQLQILNVFLGSNPQDVGLYIDFNDNHIFEESETIGITYQNSGNTYFMITLPCDAPVGTHRMRVRSQRANSGPMTPCGNAIAGETEDYNITVTNDFCPPPTNLTSSSITVNSANLSWSPVCSETQWEIVVQPQGTGTPTGSGIPVSTPTYQATNLLEYQAYEFYVRTNCGGGNFSDWQNPGGFRTRVVERDFGDHFWNVNCYYSTNPTTASFAGYYVDNQTNFNTTALWGVAGSPTSTPGYVGGHVDPNYHSYVAKRRGFTADCQQIKVLGHDDACQIKLDGVTIYQNASPVNTPNVVWAGTLDENSTIEIITTEYVGDSFANIEITPRAFVPMYADNDGDGYGDPTQQTGTTCAAPVPGSVLNADDCDDTDPLLNIPQACQNYGVYQNCGCQCEYGFSGSLCQTNVYCAPNHQWPSNEIGSITIDGTPFNSVSGYNITGYSYFGGAPNYTASLQAGTTYTMRLTSVQYTQSGAVWIDGNNDGIYSAAERVGFYDYTPAGSTTAFNITPACTMLPGVHRMRVRVGWESGANIPPCDYVYTGETEEYNITITSGPCVQPQTLAVSNITTTTATLSWTVGCNATSTEVAIQAAGSGMPTVNGVAAGNTSYAATNLESGTAYEYYVRAVCSTGTTSAWSGPIAFTTILGEKGFGNGVWNVNCYNGSPAAGNFRGYYVDNHQNFNTNLSWDANTTPSNAAGYIGQSVTINNHSYVAKRRGFTPGCYKINILKHDDGTLLFVNGVQVFQDLGCCGPNLNVWRGTLDANSTVEIRLLEVGGLSEANYELVPDEIPLYVDADNDGFGDALLPSVMGCTSGPGYTTNNLDCDDSNPAIGEVACQNGGVKVDCGCNCPFGYSGANCEISIFCATTTSTSAPSYGTIKNVSIVGTTLSNNTGGTNTYYTYFYGQPNYTATLLGGGTYTMNIASEYGFHVGVWIDYNDDGNFSASERVDVGDSRLSSMGTVTIAPSCLAPLGLHRMRVRSNYYGSPAACGYESYSETEDYNITLSAPEACPKPKWSGATDLAATTATINWIAGCSETQWEYAVQLSGMSAPTSGTLTSSATQNLTNLAMGATYDVYIRAICQTGVSVSAWAGPFTFATIITPLDYGDNVWNVNCYDFNTGIIGYYVDNGLGFNTTSMWPADQTPSSAATYVGLDLPDDNYAYEAKRKGFTPGCYQVKVLYAADESYIYIDGNYIWYGCCGAQNEIVWTGTLNEDSQIDVYGYDYGTHSATNFEITLLSQITNLYVDADADGYGDPASTPVFGCPSPGLVGNNLDCNDAVAAIHPNAVEVPYNGIDDDCDGTIDETGTVTTTLLPTSCGTTLASIGSLIGIQTASGHTITAYRIRVTNGAQVQVIEKNVPHFTMPQFLSYAYATTYTVEIQLQRAGVWQAGWGTSCFISTPAILEEGGAASVSPSQCGLTLAKINTLIATTSIQGVTGYRFRITNLTDPLGPNAVQTIDRTQNWFSLQMLTRYNYGTTYRIEVAVKTTATYGGFGAPCEIASPPVPSLVNCGGTVVSGTSYVSTASVSGATQYRFQITRQSDYASATIDRNTNYFIFNSVPASTFTAGALYTVRVAVMTTGTWSPFSDACEITSPGGTARAMAAVGNENESVDVFKIQAHPNPFTSDFGIDATTSGKGNVQVNVYDMLGKLIESRQVKWEDLSLEKIGTQYPSGIYNVIVTQQDVVKTLRVIKR